MSGGIDRYSDDAAQTDPTKDGLAVSPFAKRLAEHLRDTEAPNGYVIGLSGEWGSGKTSVLNYTRKYLEEIAPQREGETASIAVVEFRPWLVSGHQDLFRRSSRCCPSSWDASLLSGRAPLPEPPSSGRN